MSREKRSPRSNRALMYTLSLAELKVRAMRAAREATLLQDQIQAREIAHRAPAVARATDQASKAAGYFRNGEPRDKPGHREIARRYAWEVSRTQSSFVRPGKTGTSQVICTKRMREIEAIITKRHGAILPQSHAGVQIAEIMSHHIAHARGDMFEHIVAWLNVWTPWMTRQEKVELAERVLARRRKYRADTLGQRLQLSYAERTELQIKTIGAFDVSADERRELRLASRRKAAAKIRRKRGAKPRARYLAQSLARTRPWEALGMSRRTWYRHGKPSPSKVARPVGGLGGWEGLSGKIPPDSRLAQVKNPQVDYQLPSDKKCHRRAGVLPLAEISACSGLGATSSRASTSTSLQVTLDEEAGRCGVGTRRRRTSPTSSQTGGFRIYEEELGLTAAQRKRRRRKYFGSEEWHRLEKFMAEERKRLGIRSVVDEYEWPGGDNGRKPQGK